MIARILALISVALLAGCVSTNDLGVSQKDWKAAVPSQKQQMKDAYRNILIYQKQQEKPEPQKPGVNIVLEDGSAMMPPFVTRLPIQKVHSYIPAGECRHIPVSSESGRDSVSLTACYIKGVLALDPSHINVDDWQGTRFFYYNPLWLQGFTYDHISTDGYARLSQVNLTVSMDAA